MKLRVAAWFVRHIRYEASVCAPIACLNGTFQDGKFSGGFSLGVFKPGPTFGLGYASASPRNQKLVSEQFCLVVCYFSGQRSGGKGDWHGLSITNVAIGAGAGPSWGWSPWGSVSDDMRRNPDKWEH